MITKHNNGPVVKPMYVELPGSVDQTREAMTYKATVPFRMTNVLLWKPHGVIHEVSLNGMPIFVGNGDIPSNMFAVDRNIVGETSSSVKTLIDSGVDLSTAAGIPYRFDAPTLPIDGIVRFVHSASFTHALLIGFTSIT